MKLLYLTPRLPYPPLRGDQLVAFHRLRILGRRHDITLLSLHDAEPAAEAVEELRRHVERLELVRLPKLRSIANVIGLGATSRTPLQVVYFQSREFQRRLDRLLAESRFDLVHAFFHRTAPYLLKVETPRVLDAMDSLELRLQRQTRTARWPRRWAVHEELRRMRTYERQIGRTAEAVIVVSAQDADYFPSHKVAVVENGVDTDLFIPVPELRREGHLVFSGRMGYAPNAEAACWFVRRCMPLIQERVPGATLSIVGADPPRQVRRLARTPGIDVTGYVESIPRALNEASVVVAPLRSGSGMQNKILEAMACARPVVATAIGRGAIRAEVGREIRVADEPRPFAEEVTRLLRNPDIADEVGARGRAFVLGNHSWEHAGELVEAVYSQLGGGSEDVVAPRTSTSRSWNSSDDPPLREGDLR